MPPLKSPARSRGRDEEVVAARGGFMRHRYACLIWNWDRDFSTREPGPLALGCKVEPVTPEPMWIPS